MMYCRYCGTQLADGTAFCIKCGKKTVKLRPRTQPVQEMAEAPIQPVLPLVPPPAAKPTWQGKAGTMAAAIAQKAGPAAVKLAEGAKNAFAAMFAFAKQFDAAMWAVCGVFLGLEIVALVELIASASGSALLFSFLQEVPTVLLLAWLVCLVIAQVTLICAYNYKQTDEYKQAVAHAAEDAAQEPVQTLPPVIEAEPISAADGQMQDMPPEAPQEEPVREKLSQEAEDIIAELEKLSLTL